MRKVILGTLAGATLLGTVAVGVPAASAATNCQTVPNTTGLATFTALQPKDAVGQFDNVWEHNYAITVNPDGTFTGTGAITANGAGAVVWEESIEGNFTDANHVTFNTSPVGGGATFAVTNAPTDGSTVHVASSWTDNEIEFQVGQPVFATPTVRVCPGILTPAVAKGKGEVSHTDYQYADFNLRTFKWDYRWSHKNVGPLSIYDNKTWIRTGATQKHVDVPAVASPLTGVAEWEYPSLNAEGTVEFSGNVVTYRNTFGEVINGTVTSYTHDGKTITLKGTSTSPRPDYAGNFTLVIRDSGNDGHLDQIGWFPNADSGAFATISGGTLTNA